MTVRLEGYLAGPFESPYQARTYLRHSRHKNDIAVELDRRGKVIDWFFTGKGSGSGRGV